MKTETRSINLSIRLITDLDEARIALSRRRGFEEPTLSPGMKAGIRRVFGEDLSAKQVVDRIVADVRARGDEAILRYSRLIDGAVPDALEVPRAAWTDARSSLAIDLQDAMVLAAERIAAFHRKQLRTSWIDYNDDGALGQIVRPLERIGIYTPG
ncbi:MAG: histidinol dehydrogenase, partial [Thermomicrobiales bacterium]